MQIKTIKVKCKPQQLQAQYNSLYIQFVSY